LLDEYFASRPGLAETLQVQPSSAAPSLSRASSSQSLRPAVPKRNHHTLQVPSSSYTSAAANPDLTNAIGRVAAARAALHANPGGAPAPPARRMSSTSSVDTEGSSRSLPPPRTPAALRTVSGRLKEPAPPPRRGASMARTPSPEPQGEWVEALYDFNSTDATDLSLRAGDQLLLVERTSDDWWTGELNGKSGLFPAAYVKTL